MTDPSRPAIPPPPPIPAEPFQQVASSHVPRPGPTMAAIADKLVQLDKVAEMSQQVLKRTQQLALMLDGYGNAHNRRLDVFHEELALMRATQGHPANDIDVTVESPRSKAQTARRALVLTGRYASYGTALAVVLRIVATHFPEYGEAIDSLLGAFGL